jgi:hypothetical protein
LSIRPLTVTVSNNGTQSTGELTAALTGTGAGSFTLTGSPITSIAANQTATFTVGPNTGLEVGTYTATVTVSGGNGITASFGVRFTVGTFSIKLNRIGYYIFSEVGRDYGTIDPLTVTVSTPGTRPQANSPPSFRGTMRGALPSPAAP